MVGLPGCGKSTYATNHLSDHDVVYLSTDAIIEAKAAAIGKTYDECFKDFIDEATIEFFNRLDDAIRNDLDIIVDRTNLSVKSRRKILARFPKDYSKSAHVICCSREIQAKRLDRPGKSIPAHVIEDMRKNFEFPQISEGFEVIYIYNSGQE